MLTSQSSSLTGGARGKETQVFLALQNLNVMPDDYFAIGDDDHLADDVVAAIARHHQGVLPKERIGKAFGRTKSFWQNPLFRGGYASTILIGGNKAREISVLLALQERGVTPNAFYAIGNNHQLAKDVVAAIAKHRIFSSPEDQIIQLLQINDVIWHDPAITEESIAALGKPPVPNKSDAKGLYCVTLLHSTGDVAKDLLRSWAACGYVHGMAGIWSYGPINRIAQHVRQRAGAKTRPTGLRWQVCELGRTFLGKSIKTVHPKKQMWFGYEAIQIATMHPKWAKAMNGKDIPFVSLFDLESNIIADADWGETPCLYFDARDENVSLHFHSDDFTPDGHGPGILL